MTYLGLDESIELSGFTREQIMNWFTSLNVIEIATCIDLIDSLVVKNNSKDSTLRFAKMCLSDCIRKVSFQRNNEWKLYRVKNWREGKLDQSLYQPLIPLFKKRLYDNLMGITEFTNDVRNVTKKGKDVCSVEANDCKNSVESLRRKVKHGFDLVVTSPPYGDSPTTMAYEQFSWLPNMWFNLDTRSPGKLAKDMLGGITAKELGKIGYNPIDKAIDNMMARPKKGRSEAVQLKLTNEIKLKNYSFYRDYYESIRNIASMVKRGGYVCFILGNRISGGQEMRLDLFTYWAF